jgi:hypothetical protein
VDDQIDDSRMRAHPALRRIEQDDHHPKPAWRVPVISRLRLSPTYTQRAGSTPAMRAASQ